MHQRRVSWRRVLATLSAGGSLFLLGECGLSDQQLTSIATSTISTGLNTLVSQGLAALLTALTQGATTM